MPLLSPTRPLSANGGSNGPLRLGMSSPSVPGLSKLSSLNSNNRGSSNTGSSSNGRSGVHTPVMKFDLSKATAAKKMRLTPDNSSDSSRSNSVSEDMDAESNIEDDNDDDGEATDDGGSRLVKTTASSSETGASRRTLTATTPLDGNRKRGPALLSRGHSIDQEKDADGNDDDEEDNDEPADNNDDDDDDDYDGGGDDYDSDGGASKSKSKSNSKSLAKLSTPVVTTRRQAAAGTPVRKPGPLVGNAGSKPSIGGFRTPLLSMRIARPGALTPVSKTSSNASSTSSSGSPAGTNHGYVTPGSGLVKPFKVPTFTRLPNGMPAGSPGADSLMRPITSMSLGGRRFGRPPSGPLHDPNAEGALVLYTPPPPTAEEKAAGTGGLLDAIKNPQKALPVPVVVDPMLAQRLRPHQVEGVRFLYECTTGLRVPNAFGCIEADEMGLGKSFMCITLLWTLIRQSPVAGKPTIEKCIIVCPSSLVPNWVNELKKWLGPQLFIQPLACDGKSKPEKLNEDLKRFSNAQGRANIHKVLIISYETLRLHIDILGKGQYGLMLCDEGHRLKNSSSQTFQALNSLKVQRRVIMTGTPIQNDLSEYFSLLNFANPDFLGTTSEFRRRFEHPILRGRDADATDKERQLSDERLKELNEIANKFIIRRTNDLLSKYLPTKYEHVVFCRFGSLQANLYEKYTNSKAVKKVLQEEEGTRSRSTGGTTSLQAITLLKKMCNHAGLADMDDIEGSESIVPPEFIRDQQRIQERDKVRAIKHMLTDPAWSGKLGLLDRMLKMINETSKDKIVLISNYTQTIDLFEQLCRSRRYGYVRLDGSMNIKKRGEIVARFNNPENPEFVFLLSSKAGGCGINLIGANRLILFDPDWNPASDQQALARVWRDGQKKTCYIYRFIAAGAIEEKIFQRQSHKQSLSSAVVDEKEDVERHFSREQMRKLFEYSRAQATGSSASASASASTTPGAAGGGGNIVSCETHDTFKCKRCLFGRQDKPAAFPMDYGDASSWDHYSQPDLKKMADPVLKACAKDTVSFVFQYRSHDTPYGGLVTDVPA
ncbi:hypothetical protein GQ42DRAFT_164865 [Ramicandelaber brevisporus]|nr:hypothetical protein GQ42DRAFT_164865 [Ramicandelaber brevisporus]